VLASTLGRDIGNGAFYDLQQRLLDPFSRNIAGDGGVVGLSAYLVNLVN